MKQKAFTLIELLVVVSIISLLSSIVLASLNEARAKARDAKRLEDLRQINIALELYRTENGSFPNIITKSNDSNWASFGTQLSPYISSIPIDPVNNNTYFYIYARPSGDLDAFMLDVGGFENSSGYNGAISEVLFGMPYPDF